MSIPASFRLARLLLCLVLPASAAFTAPTAPSPSGPAAPNGFQFIGLNGGSCGYTTFAAAQAAASDGDTLYHAAGSFVNTKIGTISKTLTIIAATFDCTAPNATATLNGSNTGQLITLANGATVTLTNLILTNGGGVTGGLANVPAGTRLVLNSTNLFSGTATSGGGAYVAGELVMLGGSRIYSNTATIGGGIYVSGGSLTMRDTSQVYTNTATVAGGVVAAGGALVELSDSAMIGSANPALGNHGVSVGGLQVDGVGTLLSMTTGASVANNTAASGAGLAVSANASAVLDGANISANRATGQAGGLFVAGTNVNVTVKGGTVISGNTANQGAGITLAAATASLTLSQVSLLNNIAASGGGGIRVVDGKLFAQGGAIRSNRAGTDGGGLQLVAGAATLDGTTLESNQATAGGGGAVHQTGGNLALVDTSIRFNGAATNGGGILRTGGALTLSVLNSNLAQLSVNRAGLNGGGIYDSSGLTLTLSAPATRTLHLVNNQATTGNGGLLYATNGTFVDGLGSMQITLNGGALGGAMYLDDGAQLRLDDTNSGFADFQANTATGAGGQIYVVDSPNIELFGARLGGANSGGRALFGSGGGILADHSSLLLSNVIVRHNQAAGDGGGLFATNHSTVTIRSDLAPTASGLAGQANLCDSGALPSGRYCSEFRENEAGLGGGGLALTDGSTAAIFHTAFISNSAASGAALTIDASSATVENALFTQNAVLTPSASILRVNLGAALTGTVGLTATHITVAGNGAAALDYGPGTAGQFSNNIVWDNPSLGSLAAGVTASCSDTQGGVLLGPGNLSADPLFTTTPRGPYHLGRGSPAIDACASGLSPDLDTHGRPQGLAFDMGAFEAPLSFWLNLPVVLN